MGRARVPAGPRFFLAARPPFGIGLAAIAAAGLHPLHRGLGKHLDPEPRVPAGLRPTEQDQQRNRCQPERHRQARP